MLAHQHFSLAFCTVVSECAVFGRGVVCFFCWALWDLTMIPFELRSQWCFHCWGHPGSVCVSGLVLWMRMTGMPPPTPPSSWLIHRSIIFALDQLEKCVRLIEGDAADVEVYLSRSICCCCLFISCLLSFDMIFLSMRHFASVESCVPKPGPQLVSAYMSNCDFVHLARSLWKHALSPHVRTLSGAQSISYVLGYYLMAVCTREEAWRRRGRSGFDLAVHYSSTAGWAIKLPHTFISRVVEFCEKTDTFASRHLPKRLRLHRTQCCQTSSSAEHVLWSWGWSFPPGSSNHDLLMQKWSHSSWE